MPKGKILTIDDDTFYENLYSDILVSQGFKVQHALNASDGYELIQTYSPDIITLDIMMPEKNRMMDGYGLLKEIRRTSGCEQLPVIVISSLSETSDIQRALKLGANDYIPKYKLSPQLLIDEVNRLLG